MNRDPLRAGTSPKPTAATAATPRGKHQDTPVDPERSGVAHRLGDEPFEKAYGWKRKGDSGQRAQGGEREALGEKLTDQPSSAGAKRRAHRDLSAARCAA